LKEGKMPVTIPLEVYEEFEKGLGKEGAKKVIKGLESVISEATEYKWKVTKDELLDAIRKEFVTRELFEERINALRIELEGKIELVKADVKRIDMKLNFLIILMIIALTLMNPVMAEIIKNLLKL
jgi:DNA repair exonuclease SbcCD nuclease subunit